MFLHSFSFSENLRSVRDEAVETVMGHFFKEHPAIRSIDEPTCSEPQNNNAADIQCEEALVEAFGK